MQRRPDTLLALAFCCLVALAGYALVTAPPLALLAIAPLALLPRAARVSRLAVTAVTDGKTGLLTAEAWSAGAARVLARARKAGRGACLFMIDVDRFKPVNDSRGHLAGDAVLRSVAEVISAQLRGDDLAGRFGGDEFVVVLTGISRTDAMGAAERVRAHVAARAAATVSVGVACAPDHGESLDELLVAADAACYLAKSGGGNQCARQPTRKPAGSPSGSDQEWTTSLTQPGG